MNETFSSFFLKETIIIFLQIIQVVAYLSAAGFLFAALIRKAINRKASKQ